MVTPSLVTTGDPVIFSRMTLRPLGPSVDFTASASWSTPDSNRRLASSPNLKSLAMVSSSSLWRVYRTGVVRWGDWLWLGDEDRPAPYLAGVEIGQGLLRLGERIGLGVQGDLAGLREHHQLSELVVGADDVA